MGEMADDAVNRAMDEMFDLEDLFYGTGPEIDAYRIPRAIHQSLSNQRKTKLAQVFAPKGESDED